MDPLEQIIADALDVAGIAYVSDFGGGNPSGLDFLLTESGVEIEVKRFHTERIARQMGRADNVIAIQGIDAVRLFAKLLKAETIARKHYAEVFAKVAEELKYADETVDAADSFIADHLSVYNEGVIAAVAAIRQAGEAQ